MATLVVAGAQKSASSAVAQWFATSASVASHGLECLAFEGHGHRRHTERLRRSIQAEEVLGLIPLLKRPEIFHNDIVRTRAASALPQAYALAILRHPVDRSVSAWSHYRHLGVISPRARLGDCVLRWRRGGGDSAEGQIVEYSCYSRGAERFLRSFRRSSIMLTEEVVADPRRALGRLVESLDLKGELPALLPLANTRAERLSVPTRSSLAGKLGYRWDHRDQLLVRRGVLARVAVRGVAHRTVMEEPGVTESDRLAVLEAVAGDLGRLEEVLARTVPPGWRSLTSGRPGLPRG